MQARFLTIDDVPAWSEFYKYPEAIDLFGQAFLGPGNPAEFWVTRQLQRYQEKLHGHQAIIKKDTGEFIGQAGLLSQEVDGKFELEVGYHMIRPYWGNGYAPEAARMFIDYAFKNKLTDSLVSLIDIRNTRSERVANKNGLVKEKQTVWKGVDVFVYRIWAEDRVV